VKGKVEEEIGADLPWRSIFSRKDLDVGLPREKLRQSLDIILQEGRHIVLVGSG
jgi:hypothetical protein